jgi:DNA-binding transcriptional regulator GbsR (MarR family)
MDRDKVLIFADHMSRFSTQRYGFPPVTGRLIGYLAVCEPMQQPIGDIAEALLTSRSAINNALKALEAQKLINRTRPAGTRADLISLSALGWENTGFEPGEYQELGRLAREGLELLKDASPERRYALETTASLSDFLAVRLPQLYEEWTEYRKQDQAPKNKESV